MAIGLYHQPISMLELLSLRGFFPHTLTDQSQGLMSSLQVSTAASTPIDIAVTATFPLAGTVLKQP
ncbi:MAG: hypothetical protein VKL00_00625 [Synechococcales bacterium]|nr:hypothetical protein [Synechococcales bacterium]